MDAEDWLKAMGFQPDKRRQSWTLPGDDGDGQVVVFWTNAASPPWVATVARHQARGETPKAALAGATERAWHSLRPMVKHVKAAQGVLGR